LIRVFFATQPGVLFLMGIEPDSYDFNPEGNHCGQRFYLTRRGKGWVLFQPRIMGTSANDGLPRADEPQAGPLGTTP
jgi:hypothetical protein